MLPIVLTILLAGIQLLLGDLGEDPCQVGGLLIGAVDSSADPGLGGPLRLVPGLVAPGRNPDVERSDVAKVRATPDVVSVVLDRLTWAGLELVTTCASSRCEHPDRQLGLQGDG